MGKNSPLCQIKLTRKAVQEVNDSNKKCLKALQTRISNLKTCLKEGPQTYQNLKKCTDVAVKGRQVLQDDVCTKNEKILGICGPAVDCDERHHAQFCHAFTRQLNKMDINQCLNNEK